MSNLLTESMERLYKMMGNTDAKLKEYAQEPYGQRKTTPKEQRDMYENLTVEQFEDLVGKHGLEEVNKWLLKMERGG